MHWNPNHVFFVRCLVLFLSEVLRSTYIQIAVFAGGVDTSATETKGTVLIHSAEQVRSYHDELFSTFCHEVVPRFPAFFIVLSIAN
jgi:hypothetical protein